MGSFAARTKFLEDEVGGGNLTMGAVVEQPYAAAQHNRAYYKHPRGGHVRYLELGFIERLPEMMNIIARYAVTPDGSLILGAAIEVSEVFDDIVARGAPILEDILKESTYSYVLDQGSLIYTSAPRAPRRFDKQ